MAHFLGEVEGQRGVESRLGSKKSGLRTTAASWAGAIKTTLYVDAQGRDCYRVEQTQWQGKGIAVVIAEGIIGVVGQ